MRGRHPGALIAAAVGALLGTRSRACLSVAGAASLLLVSMAAQPVTATAAAPSPAQSGDEIVTGTGDTSGWHLYSAVPGDGWKWHPLATLQPGGYEDERWIGEQCLTGDGRFVVADIAPWHANNTEAGMDAGGLAYVVDAHSGRARPLAAGVSLAYFNPGCGAGGTVALTSYLGRDQTRTHVSVRDAASGAELTSADIGGEVTSAVPVLGGIVGAIGDSVVGLSGTRATPLAHVHGQAFDLRANDAGGVDVLSASGAATSTIWRLARGRLRIVGTGPLPAVQLLAGRGGATTVAGATSLAAGSGLRVSNPSPGARITAAALDGGAFLSDVQPAGAGIPSAGPGGHLMLRGSGGGVVSAGNLPPPSTNRIASLPAGLAPTPAAPRAVTSVPASATTPACAVPRLDIWNQVLQPNSAQIDWAIQQSVRGWLVSGNTLARPVIPGDYLVADSQSLPQYYPSQDFPPPDIFGHTGVPVPPQVIRGILAQESNWNQASWHAAIGDGGDPLIASYYGSSDPANPSDINFANADCGYGVGQLTDIMRAGAINQSTQVAVAIDYAENVAAAVQALVIKWNQLAERLPLAVTINNGDPSRLENWYAAIWAYNTGVHVGDPGYGLGWFNNPANPIYPANRHPFLHTWANSQPVRTYGDAASPQLWPYQEKVFGWMEVPLVDSSGQPRYAGTYDWASGTGRLLALPGPMTFCSTTVNSCDPTSPANPCPSLDSRCWWDAPVEWIDCTASLGNACAPTTFTINSNTAPEPPATHLDPACGVSGLSSEAVIVDDMSLVGNPGGDPNAANPNPGNLDPNVVGCPLLPSWQSSGTFTLTDSSGAAVNDRDPASIDLHQLGVGFGGHIWFTHTRPQTDSARAVTGTWTPNLPTSGGVYQVLIFVPDNGATSGHAKYTVTSAFGATAAYARTIDQNPFSNQWVSIGYFQLYSGASVSLSSITDAADATQGSDLAFAAVAFVKAPFEGYVALGDSYSSGEGAGPFDPSTDAPFNSSPSTDHGDLCHRSANAYSRQFAAMTTTFAGTPVVHLACSGANIGDIDTGVCYTIANDGTVTYPSQSSCSDYPGLDNGGSLYYNESDQLSLLQAMSSSGSEPRLVTVGIGGNDAGFVDVIGKCATLDPFDCQPSFTNPDGSNQIQRRIWGLRQPLATMLMDIKKAAPDAIVVLVGYPTIFQTSDTDPQHRDCTYIPNSDRMWLNSLAQDYDTVAAQAASDAGVQYVSELDALNGHELCTADPWMNAPSVPPNSNPQVSDQYFHPNATGYTAMAAFLRAGLQVSVP